LPAFAFFEFRPPLRQQERADAGVFSCLGLLAHATEATTAEEGRPTNDGRRCYRRRSAIVTENVTEDTRAMLQKIHGQTGNVTEDTRAMLQKIHGQCYRRCTGNVTEDSHSYVTEELRASLPKAGVDLQEPTDSPCVPRRREPVLGAEADAACLLSRSRGQGFAAWHRRPFRCRG
jgi:hypothetical protein